MNDNIPASKLDRLVSDYPALSSIRGDIEKAFHLLGETFETDGKLLLCGNGGSACDCEHIAGELMKSFLIPRPLTASEQMALLHQGETGEALLYKLQRALPTIVLNGLPGLSSAFLNDVDGCVSFAQQAFAFARPGDALIGISTSGNARNVLLAAAAARARGAKIVAMTGEGGGALGKNCDALIAVPARETYRVQEMHLPIYHALCAMLEERFFGEAA